MAITLRTVTGSALSFLQVDENFSSYYYSASVAGTTLTLFRTGSSLIGVPPSSTTITIPSTSKWIDSGGGIQRTGLVRVYGPFAQGDGTTAATGLYSHAQGDSTVASATGSHAEGLGTVASGSYQHVQGQYNISSSAQSAFIIGNGTADGSRSNLIFASGSQFQVSGSLNVSGAINTVGNLTVQGNITAQQYIVSTSVYYVTESYNSGSHIFGNSLDDTHQFTGSVLITGSLNVTSGITGSLFGTASRAVSASWAPNAGPIEVYNNVIDFGTLYSTAPPAGIGTNITQSIVFGWAAGELSNNINAVNFLGNRAGRYSQNVEYSNFFGYEAGRTTSASRSNFLGGFTGRLATNASDSNFLGYSAGDQASAAPNSNFLGYQAGLQAISASNSNFFGRSAGQHAASASFSTLIGHQVGFETTATASNSIGSNNIIIGTNITLAAQQRNAINLGGIIFATGSYATTTGNPFSGSMPSSRVGIATTTPQHTLDVNGSTRISNGLTVTGSSILDGVVNLGTTASTTGELVVYGNNSTLLLTRGNGDTSIRLNTGDTTPGSSGSLYYFGSQFFEIDSLTRLKLSTNDKERITIQNDGAVIINSGSQATAPTVLQVTGSVSISDILTLTRRTTTPTPVEGMIIASGSAGDSKLYYYNGTIWNALF